MKRSEEGTTGAPNHSRRFLDSGVGRRRTLASAIFVASMALATTTATANEGAARAFTSHGIVSSPHALVIDFDLSDGRGTSMESLLLDPRDRVVTIPRSASAVEHLAVGDRVSMTNG